METLDHTDADVVEAPDGTEVLEVAIQGMSCDGCVARIRAALAGVAGLEAARVRLGRATLVYWPQAVTAETLFARIEGLGYRIPVRQPSGNPVHRLLERMGDANDRALEGYELDCCKMKKK